MRTRCALLFAACLFSSSPALANGQSTHLWITDDAVTRLPPGELRALLEDPSLRQMLRNGTMFPDGGYPLGDPYAEIAHWEPFQIPYLEWIRATYRPPWSTEARQHIAFFMGLASHGMADQFHDALYMERAKQYDADRDWNLSMDEATDVEWVWLTVPQEVTMEWIPADALVEIYRVNRNYVVTPERLKEGQGLLRAAVYWVGAAGQDWDVVREHRAQFPWATAHLEDAPARGNPRDEAAFIARYWQVLWDRLNDVPSSGEVLGTVPEDGALGHERDASKVESRITVVFPKGLHAAGLDENLVHVRGPRGDVPFHLRAFYGENCHVLHIIPEENLDEDADYSVTVDDGLPAWDGTLLKGHAFGFSTRPPPPPAPADAGAPDAASPPQDPPPDEKEGCTQASPSLIGLIASSMARSFSRARRRRQRAA